MEKAAKNTEAVILDIDGVVNSFSNRKFYVHFSYHLMHELAKVKGRKQLLCSLLQSKRLGGTNALFKFVRNFCGDEKTFNKFCHNLTLKLNFDLIKHDPAMKNFMKRMNSFSDIIIRTDGLSEVAQAVWQRVIENCPSAQIKTQLIKNKMSPTKPILFFGKPITFSGIVENDFQLKSEGAKNWHEFAAKNKIDLSKSVLIDDSRKNCRVAQSIGMTTVHISRLDSFLQDISINVFNQSLSDVLGTRTSTAMKHLNINYGQKVDITQFFRQLLQIGKSRNNQQPNTAKNSNSYSV